uniref:CFA20 domain-containing protein n=1 Tax=Micromonas pusilla TaxID=38833 RepID=A0A7S0KRI9_MICPS
MFSTFQGGPFVEVFTPQGKDPTEGWKMLGGKCVKRTYEKGVKGYVHHVTGPPGLKMQLPADERRGLGLKQPYLVFQMLLPAGQHVSLEIVVADQEGTRRRLILSTSFCDVKSTPLHAQVPLPDALVPRDRWTNLALDLPALTATLWAEQRAEFRSAEGVSVGSTCALRKIFTAKSPPQEHGVDPEVSREAARIKDTTTEGGGGHARVTARNDGSLGIRGVGCGPGDASRTQPAGTRLAVPEPVPRAADFLPGVDRTTVLLDPAKLMACRVAGLPTTNDADVEGRGWDDDEGGFGGLAVAGLRITGKGGGHHHHHLSTSAPTSGRKQHPSSGGVSSRGHSREGAGVHLAFGTRVASTPPSRGRSRPTSQGYRDEGNGAGGAARRWSPTNGTTTNGVHSRDGTPRSGRTRAERFNEDLASYFAAQGHGRSSGFIDRLNSRNSADGYNSGGPGFPVDMPHVDARPKLPSSPGGGAGGGLISRGSHEWDDDMAALGDLGASVSPKGAASGRRSVTFGLASPKTPGATPGAGSRRTHAASQPRAPMAVTYPPNADTSRRHPGHAPGGTESAGVVRRGRRVAGFVLWLRPPARSSSSWSALASASSSSMTSPPSRGLLAAAAASSSACNLAASAASPSPPGDSPPGDSPPLVGTGG